MTNGDVWQQPEFPNHSRVVLWIEADQWVMVGLAHNAPPLVCSCADGRSIWTAQDLTGYLRGHRYEQVDGLVGEITVRERHAEQF